MWHPCFPVNEIKKYLTRLAFTENTELSRVPSFKPGEDYDIASNASPAVGNTAFVFLPSRFMRVA